MKTPLVICAADVSLYPDVLDPFRDVAEIRLVPGTRDAVLREIPSADAYFATLAVRVNGPLLDRAGKLRVVATPLTGLDHIDTGELARRGIDLLCLKDDRAFLDRITATAELTWALLLAVVRRLPAAFESAMQGKWARDEFRGRQLSGKTLGILGYGRLGRIVGEYAAGFRMRVLACDVAEFSAEGVRRVDMDTLFRESDAVSIHVHLTPENTGLVGEKQFALMKKGALLLNTSRGAIVDEDALLRALESGKLGGAGLDVIRGEWSDNLRDHPLIRYARTHDNLVITPHVGGVTFESQAMVYRRTAEKLRSYLAERGMIA